MVFECVAVAADDAADDAERDKGTCCTTQKQWTATDLIDEEERW
jgi:hypothetical protein